MNPGAEETRKTQKDVQQCRRGKKKSHIVGFVDLLTAGELSDSALRAIDWDRSLAQLTLDHSRRSFSGSPV